MKNILLIFCLSSMASCAFLPKGWRSPSQEEVTSIDLLEKNKTIIDRVATRDINPQSCESELGSLIQDFNTAPAILNTEALKTDGVAIIEQSFIARIALHSMIEVLPDECKLKIKELYLKMRLVEDLVGVYQYGDTQITAESVEYDKGPTPIYEASKFHPYQSMVNGNSQVPFEFQNGDILLTSNKDFQSRLISGLAEPQALFNHIALVHVDEATKNASAIESVIGKGVESGPIEGALRNGNSRIMILRARDSLMAQTAANHIHELVKSQKNQNKVIPYDDQLDFFDNLKLSAPEVVYDAFKAVSNNEFIVPEIASEIFSKDEKFLKGINARKGPMMFAADMEIDSRFNIVLDWTDYQVVRDSWRKSAALSEVYRWIEEYDYTVRENVIVEASINSLVSELVPVMALVDDDFFKQTGRWMTMSELQKIVDDYRKASSENLQRIFHIK